MIHRKRYVNAKSLTSLQVEVVSVVSTIGSQFGYVTGLPARCVLLCDVEMGVMRPLAVNHLTVMRMIGQVQHAGETRRVVSDLQVGLCLFQQSRESTDI